MLNDDKQYEELGIAPPTKTGHGTEDDMRLNLVKLQPRNWRMEGNQLIADTEMGELVHFLPTDMMCMGMDEDGLPILKKIL